MPTDYQINLAKELVSSPEKRKRFYNGMLIYLALCAVLLGVVGYVSTINVLEGLQAKRHQKGLIRAVTSVSEFSKSFYKNPEKIYERMGQYTEDLVLIQQALKNHSHFLPVIGLMFSNFPEEVALQGLQASESARKITFGLVLPFSDDGGDPVRVLQSDWNSNRELMARVESIRAITSERRMVSGYPVSFVQFECVLK